MEKLKDPEFRMRRNISSLESISDTGGKLILKKNISQGKKMCDVVRRRQTAMFMNKIT